MLDSAVVEGLRARAIEAFLSVPKIGAEVGGLLLGHVDSSGSLHLEAFEEINCEHRYGPAYVLSDTDQATLAQAVSRSRLAGGQKIVGLFRSYTRGDADLDAGDEDLMQRYFPGPGKVFLLLKPRSAMECDAAFQFSGPEGAAAGTYASFPFSPKAMGVKPAPAPSPFTMPAAPGSTLPPEEPEDLPRPRLWLPLLACLVLGIGSALVYELWREAREPRWMPLGLNAQQLPGGLQLSWDRKAPGAVKASHGILTIVDGEFRNDIELTPDQLQVGQFSYRPVHGDVLFRLELFDSGIKPHGDSLRVLNVAGAIPASAPVVTPAEAHTAEPPRPAPQVAETRTGTGAITPPEAVFEVRPEIPEGIRSRIESAIVVPVEVRVGPAGEVTKAVSKETREDGVTRYLADSAVKAARRWRFTAAKAEDGRPVSARKTIEFKFSPPSAP